LHLKLRVPRWVAVFLTLVLAVAILTLLGVMLTTSATRLAANAGNYQAQVRSLIDAALARLPMIEQFGFDPDEVIRLPLTTISTVAVGLTNAIVSLVSQGSVVLIFLLFLLLGGSTREAPAGGMWGEAEGRVQRYLVFKFILSGVTGVLVGTILAFLGIDLAMAFGLMAFLLNFIPSIGSIVATLLPLPVVLVSADISVTTAVLAILLPGAVQMLIGNVIEPKLMGDELDLHPVTILLGLMIWGALWGIVGMLLATPITAVMKIMFEKMELTRPIANLLAGRMDELGG
jgi:AI-2 transport protein TqsA